MFLSITYSQELQNCRYGAGSDIQIGAWREMGELNYGREECGCDGRKWVHSLILGEGLAGAWLQCERDRSESRSVLLVSAGPCNKIGQTMTGALS